MEETKKKKKYEKPELKSIHLLAEEVLAVGCKASLSGVPSAPSCDSGFTPCIDLGS
jgi:hypothetical protein